MDDLNDKITGGNLAASEWNQPASEIQNVIEALNIALSGGDLNQLGKGIAGYVANSNFYTDSGVADAYVLAKIGNKQTLPEYTDGMIVEFLAGNTNAGSSTINVAGLGIKNIVGTSDGGEISGRVQLRYRTSSGDFEIVQAIVSGASIATTSGTAHDFIGIPSWVKKITIMLSGVSSTGTSFHIIQLGDSGGIETSGYLGTADVTNHNAGFIYTDAQSAVLVGHVIMTLALVDRATNTWIEASNFSRSDAGSSFVGSGTKVLSGILDRIRLTTEGGSDTFDAGLFNILYE